MGDNWTKGPTSPLLDAKRFVVRYRYRLPGERLWKQGKIQVVQRSEGGARARVIGFLSKRWRAEVEVYKVEEVKDAPKGLH